MFLPQFSSVSCAPMPGKPGWHGLSLSTNLETSFHLLGE